MVIVRSRFLEDGGYNGFFKNRMKLARAEREINDVSDCRNKNRSTGFDKPGGNRIRITLFIRTVEKDFGDLHVRELHATCVHREKAPITCASQTQCDTINGKKIAHCLCLPGVIVFKSCHC